ncbi:MAG: choice-of-anchor Q domain-containing protein [Chloroflexota bacterium]
MKRVLSLLILVMVMVWSGGERPLLAAGVVGSGTAGSCTQNALNTALSGGGLVTFNCGANPVTITVTSQKTISQNTTIDGGGLVTISGGNSTRIFNVASGVNFTVRNLTVVNGRSTQDGGGIYAERLSTLTIENSTFSGNVGYNGGGVATNGWGADDDGVVVTITGSTFSSNSATAPAIPGGGNGGGGVYLSGGSAAAVNNSTFSGNQSQNGGAIHLLHSNLLATNVTFNNNAANNTAGGGGGGAIYMDGTKSLSGEVRIVSSRFNGNTTNQLGGAIFSFPEGTDATHIIDSAFDGNVSTNRGQGGAIYHQSAHGTGPMTINRSLFVRNRAVAGTVGKPETAAMAGQGGALWLLDAAVTITNSTFTQNEASHAFSLPADDWHRGFGGAIRTSDNTTIVNSTIAGNTAGFVGGGLAGPANVKNTIIANNSGGNAWDIQQNCTDVVTNQGGNIQYPQKTTGNWNDYECFGGQTAVNPQLILLGSYGGPTQTLALAAGSPAVNGGVNNGCPATDQRGYLRQDGQCDAGAFELGATADPVITQLSPPFAGVNESSVNKTLTVLGYNFSADCVVRWNGGALATTFVDPYRLTAVIPAASLSTPGSAAITVYDPSPVATSNAKTFTIVPEVRWVYLPSIVK